jgi:chromosome segregation ATPase
MEHHAEIKDRCDDLDTRIEDMCNDIQKVRVNYKLIDQCYDIDRQVREIYDWYDYRKELLKQYECERKIALEKLKALDAKSKVLNNTIQNIKSQASFRDRHAVSYSQLRDSLHL